MNRLLPTLAITVLTGGLLLSISDLGSVRSFRQESRAYPHPQRTGARISHGKFDHYQMDLRQTLAARRSTLELCTTERIPRT